MTILTRQYGKRCRPIRIPVRIFRMFCFLWNSAFCVVEIVSHRQASAVRCTLVLCHFHGEGFITTSMRTEERLQTRPSSRGTVLHCSEDIKCCGECLASGGYSKYVSHEWMYFEMYKNLPFKAWKYIAPKLLLRLSEILKRASASF